MARITKAERLSDLLNELTALAGHGDPEFAHLAADEALLEYINNPEVTELFKKVRKWYA